MTAALRFFVEDTSDISVQKWCRTHDGLWILWNPAKVTARLWTALGAAVYTQNPQPLRLIALIDNSGFFVSAAGVLSAVRVCFLVAHARSAGRAGRAHLHNRAAIVRHSCGFEGFCGLNRRGNP